MDTTQTSTSAGESPVIVPQQTAEATCSIRLSEKDAIAVLAAGENPPTPNEAALRAAKRFLEKHG